MHICVTDTPAASLRIVFGLREITSYFGRMPPHSYFFTLKNG